MLIKVRPVLIAASLLLSCAQEGADQITSDSSSNGKDKRTNSGPKRRFMRYDINIDGKGGAGGLGLLAANATAFQISLTDCVSTYSATVNESVSYLELFEFDRGCLAKLDQFTLNSKTYTPKSGDEFSTWHVGDSAIFEVAAASPADELVIDIIDTITDPVTAAGVIHYQFSEITKGSSETVGEAIVRKSASLTVNGQASPNFKINQIELVDISATGNGEFRFQLECKDAAMSGSGNGLLCYDVLLNSISMVLAEDTYVGDPTLQDLENIFTAASGGKQIDMTTEAFAPGAGTPTLTNGGFITADTGDTDVMVLAGTKPIVQHPNMLFVLKSGPSYTYFNIDVATIVQSGDNP